MLTFVNAKINLGLNIVGKRDDGYHLLETMFYPVGVYNGTPACPSPFGDILEITVANEDSPEDSADYKKAGVRFCFSGNRVDCPPEKNLVVKAALKYIEARPELIEKTGGLTLRLIKKIPDGAGMGGGSADATFTLKALNNLAASCGIEALTDKELEAMALGLGADCPFFVKNKPAFGEGIGEILTPADEILKGKWLAVVKPDLHISTAEAFAGVAPCPPVVPIPEILKLPIEEWRGRLKNDFEDSLFPKYPVLKELKEGLYAAGAVYASMTGSGAALYGIFSRKETAEKALHKLSANYYAICLL